MDATEFDAKVEERLELGDALRKKVASLVPAVSGLLGSANQRAEDDFVTWDEVNKGLLRSVSVQYLMSYAGNKVTRRVKLGGLGWQFDLGREISERIRRLDSIRQQVQLVGIQGTDKPAGRRGTARAGSPIFVVHGHDDRKYEVVRFLEKLCTDKVVMLDERPNEGDTLIEKFEGSADSAQLAVVVLTADDEGRERGKKRFSPRARQNVIFELGYFMGALGRDRVVALADPDVERPSDLVGLVWEILDIGGGWKHRVAKELEALQVPIDIGALA